jgi:multidrug efflux pump subunit AcrB
MSEPRLGISGRIARTFLHSQITPLLALVGLLLGVFAVMVTPKEEEPQINVTFANVFVPFPGATVEEVASLVSEPAEQVFSEIEGIDHVYTLSRPGMSIITVRYLVGENRTDAIVRLYNKVFSNQDWLPEHLGVGQPLIKPKGIDDVPIVTATLWTEDPNRGAYDLQQVAHAIEVELKRVPGTRDIYTIGGADRVVHVLLDPQKMSGYNIALSDLRQSLMAANFSRDAGELVADNFEIPVQAGTFLTDAEEIGSLVVGVFDDKPVFLRNVATVRRGPDQPESYVWFGTGQAAGAKAISASGEFPAVTIAVAKKPGTNAVEIADRLIQRFAQLQGTFIPEGVNATITRNYGVTADIKAKTLIKKLIFATAVVVALVGVTLGWREAFIVGTAVIITLMITLFASWAWGFTLNRVSLFALIFSIGILVDDAIVVVENIHRHMQMGGRSLSEAIPVAVDEVGGPTILATFTVIAALLPMAFVSGLMGPYMSPIPINASMGMFISLVVAFVVTPWLTYKVMRRVLEGKGGEGHGHEEAADQWLQNLFERVLGPFLQGDQGKPKRFWLGIGILVLIVLSLGLGYFKIVVLKMLPFDDKSEFQVVLDMPEGTALEQTARVLTELSEYIATIPEVTDYQVYAGTSSPINFNGLVRQYYLRSGANVGDIQVNLVDKSLRHRKSHEIALYVRGPLQEIGRPYGANVKIVEVPPGPPVQSPLVAEVYGLSYPGQIEVAKELRAVFEQTPDIVDIDDSVEAPTVRYILHVDRQRAAHLGVGQRAISEAIATVLGGEDLGYLHGASTKYAIPIRVEFAPSDKAHLDNLLSLKVRSLSGELVPLLEMVEVQRSTRERSIYHKDLLPVVYITADMGGELDSPLYGMFDIVFRLSDEPLATGGLINQYFINQPEDPYEYSVKWDGEWQVTYETFRDMGIAYSIGLILIYLLIVAQFRSYLVPLIIMAPIPLTIIGVMPGHALWHAKFTATSMIGMIALAGIIVRNSILLVDFINAQVREGVDLQTAVIRSGAVRAKPIVLTGLAAIGGALFILDDPIFRGLAVSLISGIFVSTLLTLVVIPVLYYAAMRKRVDVLRGAEQPI